MIACRDLVVERGERFRLSVPALDLDTGLVAVMGPNGGGKTTLLEAVAGRLDHAGTVERGPIWLVGAEPPQRALVEVEALVTGHGVDEARAWLERVGYDGPRMLAHGSSGERMLVALAGALAREGEDLLLDEPVGHLDPPHVARLLPLLEDRATEHVVCLTTHDPLVAARADTVILLDGGIVAKGAPEDVLQADPLTRCYGSPMKVLWTDAGPIVRAEP